MRRTIVLKIYLALFLASFTCCSTSRHAGGYATIKPLQLQGPVKEATFVVIKKYGNNARQDTISKDSYTFDRAGNVLTYSKRKLYDTHSPSTAASYAKESETYEFDKRGQLVRITREFEGTTTDLSEIHYQRHGFRVTHASDCATWSTFSETDRHGRAKVIESFFEDGTLASRTNDYYLPGSRLSRTLEFDRKGVMFNRCLEQRDTIDGNVRYYVSDSGKRNDQSTTISTLNAQGKITARAELDESLQVVTKEHWQYDDRGNEVSHKTHDNRWNSDSYDTCTYQYSGNTLRTKTCKFTIPPGPQRGQIKQIIYTDYDEFGNYQRKITTWPKEPSPTDTTYEFRTFHYFER